jgi:hypothetical protein
MGIRMRVRALVRRRRLVPDAVDIATRLDQLDKILAELMTPSEIANASVGLEVKGFRDAVDDVRRRLPLKVDGTVDEGVWGNDKTWPLEKRRSIYWDLARIWNGARGINADELRVGRWHFVTFLVLFVIAGGGYLGWHRQAPASSPALADVVEVDRLLNTTETRLKEFRLADASTKEAAKASLTTVVPQLRAAVFKVGPDFGSLSRLSAVESDIETGRIVGARSFEDFRDQMRKTLAEFTTDGWPHISQAWLEIACWAELGTLVGILFYLSGILSNGVFRTEEVTTFWTEVAIAPVVIPAVFFLFQFVGLTDPAKATATVRLGVAFLLGFSIRRTVGLLDLAKKKILPDPDTSPTSVKTVASAPQKVPTVTTVTASTARPPAATPATFTVAVKATTANAGKPTGRVTLMDGSTVLKDGLSLAADGTASCTPQLGVGRHSMTAEYVGDETFAASKGELAHEVT